MSQYLSMLSAVAFVCGCAASGQVSTNNAKACSPGTELVEGQCVPRCGKGAVLSGGQCVAACGAGTKARAGQCVSTVKASDAPVLHAIADSMCECRDKTCANRVEVELEEWSLTNSEALVRAERRVIGRLMARYGNCMAKLKKAGPSRRPQRVRPSPTTVYSAKLGASPVWGPADAKVTMVFAHSFSEPFTERVWPTIAGLKKKYGKDLRIVFRSFVVHPQRATRPAHAACAADMQGKHRKMSELLLDAGKTRPNPDYSDKNLRRMARKVGARPKRFMRDMRSKVCVDQLKTDMADLRLIGVTGVPAFYINGRYLSGARPAPQYETLIDEELKKANARIKANKATAANYYSKFVIGKGVKTLVNP